MKRALFLPLMWMAGACTAGTLEFDLARPEGKRHVVMMQPDSAGADPLPVVILLHGRGGSADLMLGRASQSGYRMDDWAQLARRERLLLLAPDGSNGNDGKPGWNDCRASLATNPRTDDVGFISALIDQAIRVHHADPARIYVFGASNGGFLTFRLAAELGPRLAAIGVQGALMAGKSLCPPPTHALPLLVVHGTQDGVIPYGGPIAGGGAMGVGRTVAIWRKLAGLPDTPVTTPLAHRFPSDPTSATRYVWGADPASLQVELVKVEGGGHTMPSLGEDMSPWLKRSLGEMNRDLDTAAEAWAFFKDKRATPAAAPSYP